MALGAALVVLVHEWVTGGGMAGMALPASWEREGSAMRRAIAREFAALPPGEIDPGVVALTVYVDARAEIIAKPIAEV